MVYAIVIATKTDGTKVAVGGPQPLSKAKAALAELDGDGLKTAAIFELRRPRKLRKFSAKKSAQVAPQGAASSSAPPEGSSPDGGNPSPDAGAGEGAQAAEYFAQRLIAEPELIPPDGFTSDKKPSCDALGEAFSRDFSAAERDEIWAQVLKLSE